MTYWLHPEAEIDLREAAEFYRQRAGSELAHSFLVQFERAVDLILRHPGIGAIWRNGRRRVEMRRFPYGVIYTFSDGRLRVLAVAHRSRHPDYWRQRN